MKNLNGEVRFRAAEVDSTSSSEELEMDQELEEWLNDDNDRRNSFERKVSAVTARDSLIERGEVWHVAGQMT